MNNFFCVENRPQSNVKDMAVCDFIASTVVMKRCFLTF